MTLLLPGASCVCDIGADHGLLSMAILEEYGTSMSVHAVEISEEAFHKGIGRLPKHERFSAYNGDGLIPLIEKGVCDIDALIVTGIGYKKTDAILRAEHLKAVGAKQLIIQVWPPNLLSLLRLSRDLDRRGFDHDSQRITAHGTKHVSITSSFVLREEEGGTDDSDQKCLSEVLSAWPLSRQIQTDLRAEETTLFRDYLRKNLVPIGASLRHTPVDTDASSELGRISAFIHSLPAE